MIARCRHQAVGVHRGCAVLAGGSRPGCRASRSQPLECLRIARCDVRRESRAGIADRGGPGCCRIGWRGPGEPCVDLTGGSRTSGIAVAIGVGAIAYVCVCAVVDERRVAHILRNRRLVRRLQRVLRDYRIPMHSVVPGECERGMARLQRRQHVVVRGPLIGARNVVTSHRERNKRQWPRAMRTDISGHVEPRQVLLPCPRHQERRGYRADEDVRHQALRHLPLPFRGTIEHRREHSRMPDGPISRVPARALAGLVDLVRVRAVMRNGPVNRLSEFRFRIGLEGVDVRPGIAAVRGLQAPKSGVQPDLVAVIHVQGGNPVGRAAVGLRHREHLLDTLLVAHGRIAPELVQISA